MKFSKPRAAPNGLWIAVLLSILVRVVLLAFVLRAQGGGGIYTLDTPGYVDPIAGLLHGSFWLQHTPNILRTPGYPLFLLLAGFGKLHPLLWIAWQIVFSALAVALLYRIALSLSRSSTTAFPCALLYALEPCSILCSVLLIADTLLSCFIILFIYFLLSYLRTGKWGALLLSSCVLAICTYIKPVTYYLPVVIAFMFAFVPSRLPILPRLARAVSFSSFSRLSSAHGSFAITRKPDIPDSRPSQKYSFIILMPLG